MSEAHEINDISGHSTEANNGLKAKAEGRVHEIGEKARQRAGKAQERIEGQRDQVASRIEGAASRVRARTGATGPLGHKAGEKVAERMDAAAVYLHGHQTQEIAGDAVTYIRQHPIRSTIAAFVLGYLFGRIFG